MIKILTYILISTNIIIFIISFNNIFKYLFKKEFFLFLFYINNIIIFLFSFISLIYLFSKINNISKKNLFLWSIPLFLIFLSNIFIFTWYNNFLNQKKINYLQEKNFIELIWDNKCYKILENPSLDLNVALSWEYSWNKNIIKSIKSRTLKNLSCKKFNKNLWEISFLKENKFYNLCNGKPCFKTNNKYIKLYVYTINWKNWYIKQSFFYNFTYIWDWLFIAKKNNITNIYKLNLNTKTILLTRIYYNITQDNLNFWKIYLFKSWDNYELTIFKNNGSAIKFIFSINDKYHRLKEKLLINPNCNKKTWKCFNDLNKKLKLNWLNLKERLDFINKKWIIEKQQKVEKQINEHIKITKIGSELENTNYTIKEIKWEWVKIIWSKIPDNIEKIIITPLKIDYIDYYNNIVLDYKPFQLKKYKKWDGIFEYNAFYKYRNFLPNGLKFEINLIDEKGISNKDYLIISIKNNNFSNLDEQQYFVLQKYWYKNLVPKELFKYMTYINICNQNKISFDMLYNIEKNPDIEKLWNSKYKLCTNEYFDDMCFDDTCYIFNKNKILKTIFWNIKLDWYTTELKIKKYNYIFSTWDELKQTNIYTLYPKKSFNYSWYVSEWMYWRYTFETVSKDYFNSLWWKKEIVINESNYNKLKYFPMWNWCCLSWFWEMTLDYKANWTLKKRLLWIKIKFFKNKYTGWYSYLFYNWWKLLMIKNSWCDFCWSNAFINWKLVNNKEN